MIDPRLLEEFNAGVDRAKTAYWQATSPIAANERTLRRRERQRLAKRRSRERAKHGRAA